MSKIRIRRERLVELLRAFKADQTDADVYADLIIHSVVMPVIEDNFPPINADQDKGAWKTTHLPLQGLTRLESGWWEVDATGEIYPSRLAAAESLEGLADVIDKCPRCGFEGLAHDYTGMPMCLEIDGGCGWDGTMLFPDQPDSHASLIKAWDEAIENGYGVYAAGDRMRFALEASARGNGGRS